MAEPVEREVLALLIVAKEFLALAPGGDQVVA
jgi:hypothetical protein